VERYEHAQELGFYSLLYLAQAIGQVGSGEDIRIDVLADAKQAAPAEILHLLSNPQEANAKLGGGKAAAKRRPCSRRATWNS